MPWGDWQFWLVTAVAAWGVWAVVKQLLPTRSAGEPPCASCAVATGVDAAAEEGRRLAAGEDPADVSQAEVLPDSDEITRETREPSRR